MAKDVPTITIKITKNIEKALTDGYDEYLEKAADEEEVLTADEYNLHILKLGILSNQIDKKEIEHDKKKEEASNVKSELARLKREYRKNRLRIKTNYDYERNRSC